MDARDILIKPIVTEKSTALMAEGKYTFKVPLNANKYQIRDAVEEIFNVKVAAVSTMRMEGKKKRMGRFEGKRSDWKKAIVTLKEGETIELFEGV
ncbi:MAG: 50S ribosomal protein L23 [Negativicoccus massiliensis]|uniref:50S ribosomal protein L23 n=1 Tax=Negativicoccus succinicivorans TaxID=620903 RepID=UPI00096AA11B|nr:50S ribosomal protein L23 [Negativicoccus succinicivorans]MDU4642347.1 50S ribosomal protein L23 [Negativicoccus massiliensis]MBS5888044.1 50S ribosomal protein L23 [Negativicoccus succinicivorans]MBS6028205.1 50S ribosomal protein L23 [Negativicoccus succinicivorans]MDU3214444.1 50S ribosomal protein L23 [Negativicoccus succinicivorans]MDU5027978.1 50S ribosomal protein L23 [Negativicoccus succinicivorans]